MKCVCPMGGDRACPDDCPLAIWAGLSKADRKAQRKSVAERLYKQRFTMEQIATQLGVGVGTIHRDLVSFSIVEKLPPRASKRGRKGEGRPKGKRNSQVSPGRGRPGKEPQISPEAEVILAHRVLDENVPLEKAANEAGLQSDMVARFAVAREQGRREERQNPTVNPETVTLSLSAKAKLEVAKRAIERKLNAEYADRIRGLNEEVRQRVLSETKEYLAMLKAREEEADKTIETYREFTNNHKPLFTIDDFNLLRKCLHQRGIAASEQDFNQAFNIIQTKKLQLTGQKK